MKDSYNPVIRGSNVKEVTTSALVILMFCVSAVPTASAYKGYQLSRGPVDDFTLTNQDNESMNLSDFRGRHSCGCVYFYQVPRRMSNYHATTTKLMKDLAKNIKNMSQLFQ